MNYLAIIKYGLVALAIVVLLSTIYNRIYQSGYSDAQTKYTQIITKYELEQKAKIIEINNSLISLSTKSESINNKLAKEFSSIRTELNKSPLVVYKNGECTLSKEFLDSRAKALSIVNSK